MSRYRTGFYLKHDQLSEDCGFVFLEDEASCNKITPDWFLHGNCDIFACYLHEKYGYGMKAIYDCDSDELIHVYCTAEINNETVYIDVRGITNNWDEFIEEFDDWYSDECPIKPFKIPKYYREAKKEKDDMFMAAGYIESINKNFYTINS